MQNLTELLSLEKIEQLCLPSNFRYGKAIFDRGGVDLIYKRPQAVQAWVGGLDGTVREGGGSRRRTQLSAGKKGLRWHCTGNPKNHDIFCKHCVALAFALLAGK